MRLKRPFAVSVTEKSLNSQELECLPRHISLLVLAGLWRPGRLGFAGGEGTEPWLMVEAWRIFCGLDDVCVGLVGLVGLMGCAFELEDGNCSGGRSIGDLDRLRGMPARERLRERPRRIRVVMAPKNDSSVGETAERVVEVGESMSGDMAPEDWDF